MVLLTVFQSNWLCNCGGLAYKIECLNSNRFRKLLRQQNNFDGIRSLTLSEKQQSSSVPLHFFGLSLFALMPLDFTQGYKIQIDLLCLTP